MLFASAPLEITIGASVRDDRVVFAAGSGNQDLYLLDLGSGKVTPVATTPDFESWPSFSPDAKTIVYAAGHKPGGPQHIFTCGLDGSPRRQLTRDESVYDIMPSYDTTGKHIVFARARRHRPYSMGGWTWDQFDIFTMDARGGSLRQVTHGSYYATSAPRLLPGGHTVVFSPFVGTDSDLLTIADGGQATPIPLTNDGHSHQPAVSPGGRHVVYVSDRTKAYDYELWSMSLSGDKTRHPPVQLTTLRSYLTQPVFGKAGKHILFLSDQRRQGRYELWRIDRDGRNPRRLADSRLFSDPLHWKP